MSGVFGGGSAKSAAAASERQMAEQRAMLAKQEAELQRSQSELAMRTQATLRARQRGGQRALLMGDEDQSTLG